VLELRVDGRYAMAPVNAAGNPGREDAGTRLGIQAETTALVVEPAPAKRVRPSHKVEEPNYLRQEKREGRPKKKRSAALHNMKRKLRKLKSLFEREKEERSSRRIYGARARIKRERSLLGLLIDEHR
jgi:hypothetical protein